MVKWLGPLNARTDTGSVSLEVECHVYCPPEALIAGGTVVDGLGDFCENGLRAAIADANPRMEARARSFVRDTELVAADKALPRNHDLRLAVARIHSQCELTLPAAGEIRFPDLERMAKVRTVAVLRDGGEPRCGSVACNIAAGGIHEATAKIRVLPHVRRSVNLESINSGVSASFLREAAAIKGIDSGAGELLAIFRSIPLAMISRVCFLEERGVLLYTISSPGGPSSTRVHDLAAVRDRSTRKTHLVPHRTRYKTAFLH